MRKAAGEQKRVTSDQHHHLYGVARLEPDQAEVTLLPAISRSKLPYSVWIKHYRKTGLSKLGPKPGAIIGHGQARVVVQASIVSEALCPRKHKQLLRELRYKVSEYLYWKRQRRKGVIAPLGCTRNYFEDNCLVQKGLAKRGIGRFYVDWGKVDKNDFSIIRKPQIGRGLLRVVARLLPVNLAPLFRLHYACLLRLMRLLAGGE
jgi:hypothetical protein